LEEGKRAGKYKLLFFSYIFLIAKLAKTLAKIRQIFFFGFFGQLLALFLAKYISNSIDYVIITEE